MRRSSFVLLTLFALAMAVLAPVSAAGAEESPLAVPQSVVDEIKNMKTQTFIVQMLGDPVVAYEGGIKGLPATKPAKGQKINPNSAKVTKYVDYLTGEQDKLIKKAGGKKVYNYAYSFNGFAARMSGAQAASLLSESNVVSVLPDELMHVDTVTTRDFLGLNADGGIWDELGGPENAGEGVIVGIIDTGIWPESASFSDRIGESPKGKSGKLGYQQIPGWHGKCTPGEAFPASLCNQKLIGAQWFNSGYGGDAGVAASFPNDFVSARDGDGHGSHTASTAAGNYGVPVTINGEDVGMASGVAPRARIAAYKVCWGGDDGGCFSSDSTAAIDQAVADGVDVLNFSISGSQTSVLTSVEVAFLFAADAGIFVAASAGNAGPGASTVAHNSPWLTTVAAGTHDRYFAGTGTTLEPAEYTGAMFAKGPVEGDLVYAMDIVLAGQNADEARRCFPGTLDPAQAAGKIVLCDRGTIARVAKSAEVAAAGGIGMVHANTGPSSVNADFHTVPTLHVDHVQGADLRAYAQTAGAWIHLEGGDLETAEAPEVAAFSSRGPALALGGDLLKPDLMAPGVDVIAAVAPPFNGGNSFDAYSGTSMSSPHVAGLGALLTHAHPNWTPAMMKSALMTTATQETNMGSPIPGTPFGYGAGHVVPNLATDPGLVYNQGWTDWVLTALGLMDPTDMNYPSIAIGELPGTQTTSRTVTNVGSAGTYEVSIDAPPGVDVEVSPTSLVLGAGESASYDVTFTSTEEAVIGSYTFGSLTWSDGDHSVRSPLVVKPVALAKPDEVHFTGTDGADSYGLAFGYSGDFDASAAGLVEATKYADSVVDDPTNDINGALGSCDFSTLPAAPAGCVGITWHVVSIPAGSEMMRFSLFDDYTTGADDLDLYVIDETFSFFVGQSGSGTSAEEVNIDDPTSWGSTFYVAVHGWQTDGGGSTDYTMFSWSLDSTDLGNMTVTPSTNTAVLGDPATIDLTWSGLNADTKYLGWVIYDDGSDEIGRTVVRIDTD